MGWKEERRTKQMLEPETKHEVEKPELSGRWQEDYKTRERQEGEGEGRVQQIG